MKWICNKCENDDPCIHSWAGGSTQPERCPYLAAKSDWQKMVPDKPEDDKIVKACMEWENADNWSRRQKACKTFARLIQAKIEAVRSLFRNHEGRIKGLENRGCVTSNSGWVEDITEWRRESERKVEELEKILDEIPHGEPSQDQPLPKGGVAKYKDAKGVEHDLIPGVSVYRVAKFRELLYSHSEFPRHYGFPILENRIRTTPYNEHEANCTWLRDLDFPGGDK